VGNKISYSLKIKLFAAAAAVVAAVCYLSSLGVCIVFI